MLENVKVYVCLIMIFLKKKHSFEGEDSNENNDSYASMSTAAVLMMIFQYTDCSGM